MMLDIRIDTVRRGFWKDFFFLGVFFSILLVFLGKSTLPVAVF